VQEPDVPGIGAAVLAIYGGLDDRINQNIPAIEAAMGKHGKTFRKIVYPNVDHAFHNDTGPRYNAAAAKAAWGEALAWFAKYLA
jgi:carboxymethylenebutenolidase